MKKNKNVLVDDAKSRMSSNLDNISNRNIISDFNSKKSNKSSKRINIEAIDKTFNDI